MSVDGNNSDGDAGAGTAHALALIDKLSDRSKLLLKEEAALIAARLNMEFHTCGTVRDVEELATQIFNHKPMVIESLLEAITEGDPCAHILIELLDHLSHSAAAIDEMLRVGVVETLISVFPVLSDIAQYQVLQLLRLVTDDEPTADSRHRPRGRGQRIRCICRVACVRVLFSVLDACVAELKSDPSWPPPWCLTPTITLLDRITDWVAVSQPVEQGRQLAAASTWRSEGTKIAALCVSNEQRVLANLEVVAVCSDGAWRSSTLAAPPWSVAAHRAMVTQTHLRVKRWCSEPGKTPKTRVPR